MRSPERARDERQRRLASAASLGRTRARCGLSEHELREELAREWPRDQEAHNVAIMSFRETRSRLDA